MYMNSYRHQTLGVLPVMDVLPHSSPLLYVLGPTWHSGLSRHCAAAAGRVGSGLDNRLCCRGVRTLPGPAVWIAPVAPSDLSQLAAPLPVTHGPGRGQPGRGESGAVVSWTQSAVLADGWYGVLGSFVLPSWRAIIVIFFR